MTILTHDSRYVNLLTSWENICTFCGLAHHCIALSCRLCPVRSLCTQAAGSPRRVTLRAQTDHEMLQRARRLQRTPEWKARYERRAGIEGTISQGTRGFGLRRSRYIGEAKTHLQHILTASAINLVRFAAWKAGVPHAKTRISRFAALKAS